MSEQPASFDEICNQAVMSFLQTVVVIDNEASLAADVVTKAPVAAARKRAPSPGQDASLDVGIERSGESNNAEGSAEDEDLAGAHRLELNKVSRAFANHQLTCGVYLPTEEDPKKTEDLIDTTVRAILPTDACVLDWQLRKGDSGPAIKAINRVLKTDEQEGGRLRLILIYTAEDLDRAASSLLKAVEPEGYEVEKTSHSRGPVISGGHFRIVFVNKPTRGVAFDYDSAVVPWDGLPARIVEEFQVLSRGLLRAFALKSVAAVRRDMHRMLAQFDEELDPVFAGDRSTKPDPDDAGRLVAELLQSEFALSVEASGAKDSILGLQSCLMWLEARAGHVSDIDAKLNWHDATEKTRKVDDDVRRRLIKEGSRNIKTDGFHDAVHRSFFAEHRSASDDWKEISARYAVLTTLAYHAGEKASRRVGEAPSLKFGTVIGDENDSWLCIQPACDTVRVHGETPFLFIKLIEDDGVFDLIIPINDRLARYKVASEGKFKNQRELRTLWFAPGDGSDVITAQSGGEHGFYFDDASDDRWFWRAQLREITAVNIVQKALSAIGRFGLNEFEWLRTSAR